LSVSLGYVGYLQEEKKRVKRERKRVLFVRVLFLLGSFFPGSLPARFRLRRRKSSELGTPPQLPHTVRPSVSSSVCPSVRPPVCPSFRLPFCRRLVGLLTNE
jgi:hypothetical protein